MKKNAKRGRAKFMKPNKSASSSRTRGKRVAAYKAALSRGKSKTSARRSALRKVPFTANERSRGATFAGSKAKKYRKNRSSTVGGGGEAYASGWEGTFGKKAPPKRARKGKKVARKTARRGKSTRRKTTAKRKVTRKKATRRRTPAQFRTVKTTVRRKKRVAYGSYKRAKVYNPRTGRMQYSYMYRTKSGRLRRIPTRAVIGGGKGLKGFDPKRADRVRRGRQKAADKILREGDVFVANKRKRKSKSRVAAGRKLARYRKLIGEGYTKAEAHAIVYGGKKMAKKRRSPKRKVSRKKARRRVKARRRTTRKTSTRKRKSAKRVAAGKKAARTRKRRARSGSRRTYRRNGRKKAYAANRRRSYKSNRRRRKSYRSNGRRMRKNAFMANLAMVAKTGAFIAVGYVSHRVLTSLACEYLFAKIAYPEGQEASPTSLTLKKWEKPICGTVVAVVGMGAATAAWEKRYIKSETALALGGGMFASLLQSVVVSALMAFDQPKVAAHLEGYSNSMAYQLRGARGRRNRRGVHGMQSIMPRYTPVGMFEQAAAGYEQAAAGMGEYFAANAAAVGEYFVPRGTQGVGQYEPAGPLAMQAAAGTHMGQIDDGIRPDSNLDRVLDLAESAAGLGEYITATPDNGGWAENRVPTQSQWIPNGPLWAGELTVKDNMRVSETAAGILAGPGGNGILSGG